MNVGVIRLLLLPNNSLVKMEEAREVTQRCWLSDAA